MANNLWASAVQFGTAAAKPTIPDVPAGTFGMYLESDTGQLNVGSTAWNVLGGVGSGSVTTPTTADTVTNYGTSIFNATAAKSYSLAAPSPNVEKTLTTTSTSTAARTLTLVSGAIVSTSLSTGTILTFTGLGQTVKLKGLSTSQYAIIANSAALT